MSDIILKSNKLVKSFGEQTVLKDISMTIHEHDIYGFLGTNGAGKSTTMKIILGLLQSDSGTVEVFGKNTSTNRNEILKNVGALIEGFWCKVLVASVIW